MSLTGELKQGKLLELLESQFSKTAILLTTPKQEFIVPSSFLL